MTLGENQQFLIQFGANASNDYTVGDFIVFPR